MRINLHRGLLGSVLVLTLSMIPLMGGAREEMSHHCKKDIKKYCEDVKPGEGRVWNCLRGHESDLSEECREHMERGKAIHEAREEMRESCEKDIKKFCKDVEPGGGRVWSCLRDHESSLSKDCKEKVAKAKAKREACEDDIDKFCGSKKGHPEKVHKCLKKHKDELSADCKAAHPKWY